MDGHVAEEFTTLPQQNSVTPRWITVKDSDHLDAELLKLSKDGRAIIQFKAEWCKKCHVVANELEAVIDSDVVWLAVDVDEHVDLSHRFQVTAMPRIDVFARGHCKKSMEAFDVSTENVLQALKDVLTQPPALELDSDF